MQPPDSLPELDTRVHKVGSLFLDADAQIQEIVASTLAHGAAAGNRRYRMRAMTGIRDVLGLLDGKVRVQAPNLVKLGYVRGARLVDPNFTMQRENLAQAAVLATSLRNRLQGATQSVRRNADDVFRRLTLTTVAQAMDTPADPRPTAQRLVSTLQREAVVGLRDRSGARWGLEPYARMALHTLGYQAATEGTLWACLNNGYDVVGVSKRAPTSPLCEPYDGKLFSIGENTDHPRMTTFPPFHGGCKHLIYPAARYA